MSLVHPVEYIYSHFCLGLEERRKMDLLYTHQLFLDGVPMRYAMDIDDDKKKGMTAEVFAEIIRVCITTVGEALVASGGGAEK